MKTLQQIAHSAPSWSLDELVQAANEWLPQFLPEVQAHTRVREEVTPRLVRHYTSLHMLDEPAKVGREARYSYRHLLQLLLVRRLLAEGYGATAINQLAITRTNAELEALLHGGLKLAVTPANPALAFLQQVQQRDAVRSPLPALDASLPAAPPPSGTPPNSHWTRIEILPGLELHIRSNFLLPSSAQEQQTLLQSIRQALLFFATQRRSPK